MNALDLLKHDHEKVKALFEQADELSDRATTSREKLFDEIAEELTLHAKIEEKVFYPALREGAKKREERDDVLEAYEEHGVMKGLIKQLQRLEATDERFKAKLTVLKENTLHHAQEEEKTIFPIAREVLGDDGLEEVGEQIVRMKERAGAEVPEEALQ